MESTSKKDCSLRDSAARSPMRCATVQDAIARFPESVVLMRVEAPGRAPAAVLAGGFSFLPSDASRVTWTIDLRRPGAAALVQADHSTLHLLAYDQAGLAQRVAEQDVHHLDSCSVKLACRHLDSMVCGESLIIVGQITEAWSSDRPPLIRQDGNDAIGIAVQMPTANTATGSDAGSLGYLVGSAYFYLYGQMRDAGGRLGYNNIEMFILTALGERSGRTRSEIETLLSFTAHPTGLEAMDDLEACGLIVAHETLSEDSTQLTFALTATGQLAFDDFCRKGIDVEADMESLLGLSEAVALRSLLARFAEKVEPQSGVSWL